MVGCSATAGPVNFHGNDSLVKALLAENDTLRILLDSILNEPDVIVEVEVPVEVPVPSVLDLAVLARALTANDSVLAGRTEVREFQLEGEQVANWEINLLVDPLPVDTVPGPPVVDTVTVYVPVPCHPKWHHNHPACRHPGRGPPRHPPGPPPARRP
jgi:hypothetical protein